MVARREVRVTAAALDKPLTDTTPGERSAFLEHMARLGIGLALDRRGEVGAELLPEMACWCGAEEYPCSP